MMTNFCIGDRVIAIDEYEDNYDIDGVTGTVISVSENGIGVEFDININGHDLNGKLSHNGNGWFCSESVLRKIDSDYEMPDVEDNEYLKILCG